MIRQSSRILLRQFPQRAPFAQGRRFISTAPPAQRSRSWKSSAARWGLAIGIVYYYNTSNLFAEEPAYALPLSPSPTEDNHLPTLEDISQSRQRKREAIYSDSDASSDSADSSPNTSAEPIPTSRVDADEEEEDAQQAAFNEETGEINWDCPCLGGMAHGPCGTEFRTAFSCFVFSKEEPKGMDCIDQFKSMQNCFREHPEEYGAELEEEEAEAREIAAESVAAGATEEKGDKQDAAAAAIAGAGGIEQGNVSSTALTSDPHSTTAISPAALSKSEESTSSSTSSSPSTSSVSDKAAETLKSSLDATSDSSPRSAVQGKDSTQGSARKSKSQMLEEPGNPLGDTDDPVPKAAHDATSANKGR